MNGTENWLLHDHRIYEELLLEFQRAAAGDEWDNADKKFHDLVSLLKGHFLMEEEVLFPAYEDLEGAPEGPTDNLRADHVEIRAHLQEIAQALKMRNTGSIAQVLAALDQLTAKHHEKEESIFLPMAGQALLRSREEIMEQLKQFDWKYTLRAWKV